MTLGRTTACRALPRPISVALLTDSGFARSDPASGPVRSGRSGPWDQHDNGAPQQSGGIPASAFAGESRPLVPAPCPEVRA
jgi:hypothetical protein